jgi:hypothetical protein
LCERRLNSASQNSDNIVILYNTIVGLAAGVGLLLVAQLLKQFAQDEKVQPEGFALAFFLWRKRDAAAYEHF